MGVKEAHEAYMKASQELEKAVREAYPVGMRVEFRGFTNCVIQAEVIEIGEWFWDDKPGNVLLCPVNDPTFHMRCKYTDAGIDDNGQVYFT